MDSPSRLPRSARSLISGRCASKAILPATSVLRAYFNLNCADRVVPGHLSVDPEDGTHRPVTSVFVVLYQFSTHFARFFLAGLQRGFCDRYRPGDKAIESRSIGVPTAIRICRAERIGKFSGYAFRLRNGCTSDRDRESHGHVNNESVWSHADVNFPRVRASDAVCGTALGIRIGLESPWCSPSQTPAQGRALHRTALDRAH